MFEAVRKLLVGLQGANCGQKSAAYEMYLPLIGNVPQKIQKRTLLLDSATMQVVQLIDHEDLEINRLKQA